MKATKSTTRKPAKKKPGKVRGNISPEEIQPLIMAALEAYAVQDPGISFDEWRAEEVKAAVGRDGLTACDHDHFCDLMGHFKTGAGKDDEALTWYLKGSKNTERQIAWSIANTLAAHITLAHSTVEALTAATPPRRLKGRLAAREAILDHPEGPFTFGDLVTIVRGKTSRPDLTLDPDLAVSLAERCDKLQLAHIRFTVVNRIAEREGRGNTCDRNRSQNSDAAKARRSPHEMAARPGFEDPF
jgi:hypothetical protein